LLILLTSIMVNVPNWRVVWLSVLSREITYTTQRNDICIYSL